MTELDVPIFLQQVLQPNDEPEVIFSKVLPVLGSLLQCDRCFLYLRQPQTKMGKVTHCWRRNSQIPELIDADWKLEPESLALADPLFNAALQAKPSIFVEDVETANPAIVNRAFEQENFGHRALIHAHLIQARTLWGVLQPCVFNQPRHWSTFDRDIIAQVEEFITPHGVSYVSQYCSDNFSI